MTILTVWYWWHHQVVCKFRLQFHFGHHVPYVLDHHASFWTGLRTGGVGVVCHVCCSRCIGILGAALWDTVFRSLPTYLAVLAHPALASSANAERLVEPSPPIAAFFPQSHDLTVEFAKVTLLLHLFPCCWTYSCSEVSDFILGPVCTDHKLLLAFLEWSHQGWQGREMIADGICSNSINGWHHRRTPCLVCTWVAMVGLSSGLGVRVSLLRVMAADRSYAFNNMKAGTHQWGLDGLHQFFGWLQQAFQRAGSLWFPGQLFGECCCRPPFCFERCRSPCRAETTPKLWLYPEYYFKLPNFCEVKMFAILVSRSKSQKWNIANSTCETPLPSLCLSWFTCGFTCQHTRIEHRESVHLKEKTRTFKGPSLNFFIYSSNWHACIWPGFSLPPLEIQCLISSVQTSTVHNLHFKTGMVLTLPTPYGHACFLKNEEICGWSLRPHQKKSRVAGPARFKIRGSTNLIFNFSRIDSTAFSRDCASALHAVPCTSTVQHTCSRSTRFAPVVL